MGFVKTLLSGFAAGASAGATDTAISGVPSYPATYQAPTTYQAGSVIPWPNTSPSTNTWHAIQTSPVTWSSYPPYNVQSLKEAVKAWVLRKLGERGLTEEETAHIANGDLVNPITAETCAAKGANHRLLECAGHNFCWRCGSALITAEEKPPEQL